jgi:hypothetical protein
MATARAPTTLGLSNSRAVDMLAWAAAMLEVAAFAYFDRAQANGIVSTAVLAGDIPYTAFVDELRGMFAEQTLPAQDPRVKLYFGGGFCARMS